MGHIQIWIITDKLSMIYLRTGFWENQFQKIGASGRKKQNQYFISHIYDEEKDSRPNL